jgi:hypothetical protein
VGRRGGLLEEFLAEFFAEFFAEFLLGLRDLGLPERLEELLP